MKKIFRNEKPQKITFKGNAKILSSENEKYVIKPKKKDLKSLYDYLRTRQFHQFPDIVEEDEENYVFSYIDNVDVPINQKSSDMANLLAMLHNKTAYFIPITADYVKKISENIESNIIDIEKYYSDVFEKIAAEVVMSPSNYLLIRNSSKILANFDYIKKELNKWLKLMENKNKERVVYCHNNLSVDHCLSNTEDYLISWDKYQIDTPVLDLMNLYHNDFDKYEFSNFFEVYNQRFSLNEEEKLLFFLMVALPEKIEFMEYEYDNTEKVNRLLRYIYKTEQLVRPYYSPQNPK